MVSGQVTSGHVVDSVLVVAVVSGQVVSGHAVVVDSSGQSLAVYPNVEVRQVQ